MKRLLAILIIMLPIHCFATTLSQGMVVSENRIASQIGADILTSGGNAIDAAVGVGYALAVVNPCCGNLGGGGFMTIHFANGKSTFINFRETAPLKAIPNMFDNTNGEASIKGYLAVAVPGTVLGLDTVLQKYGRLSRIKVMTPAIQIAEQGYIVTPYEAALFAKFKQDFQQQPEVAAIYIKDQQTYAAGQRLIQTDLANTLKAIANQGPDVFYKGWIAKAIVDASNKHGGILTLADFAKYTVKETSPIQCEYRGYTIISAPPPSSGGVTLCEMLNILENFQLNRFGYHSFGRVKTIIETMRHGFIDRNLSLGDPDFVSNPIDKLLSKPYAKNIAEHIAKTHSNIINTSSQQENELTDTTHYSVLDKEGNAVSVTYTLNGFFGSGVIAGNTGFFLNNEMDDFATRLGQANKFGLVQQQNNAIQPGKRPLSSMTPTIVMKDGRLVMVIGSPGGPRIITTVLLTLSNIIDYNMTLQQAVDSPRFHYQDQPDVIDREPFVFPIWTNLQLQMKGYHLAAPHQWGAAESILIKSDGTVVGANDKRRPDGAAIAAPLPKKGSLPLDQHQRHN